MREALDKEAVWNEMIPEAPSHSELWKSYLLYIHYLLESIMNSWSFGPNHECEPFQFTLRTADIPCQRCPTLYCTEDEQVLTKTFCCLKQTAVRYSLHLAPNRVLSILDSWSFPDTRSFLAELKSTSYNTIHPTVQSLC